MDTASAALIKLMDTGETDKTIEDLDLPDIPLWAAWCIQQYYKFTNPQDTLKKYGALLEKIINHIIDGKQNNLYIGKDGLLSTDGSKTPATWMDAIKTNGLPSFHAQDMLSNSMPFGTMH